MKCGHITKATLRSRGEQKAAQDTLLEVRQVWQEGRASHTKVNENHIIDDRFEQGIINVLKIENARLKKLLVESMLEVASLREVLRKSAIVSNDPF